MLESHSSITIATVWQSEELACTFVVVNWWHATTAQGYVCWGTECRVLHRIFGVDDKALMVLD